MAANRRSYVGRVVSAKMQNTLVVAVDRVRHHAVYGKALRRKTVLYVHDPLGESQYGDLVRVTECRPVSKTKRFRLQAVLQRHEILRPEEVAEAEAVMAEAIETPELVAAVAVTEDAAESESDVEETVAAMDEAVDESVDEAAEEQEAAAEELEAPVAEAPEEPAAAEEAEAPVAEAPEEPAAAEEAEAPVAEAPEEPAAAEEVEAPVAAAPEEPAAAEEAEAPVAEATEGAGSSWERLRPWSQEPPKSRWHRKSLRRRSQKLPPRSRQ